MCFGLCVLRNGNQLLTRYALGSGGRQAAEIGTGNNPLKVKNMYISRKNFPIPVRLVY